MLERAATSRSRQGTAAFHAHCHSHEALAQATVSEWVWSQNECALMKSKEEKTDHEESLSLKGIDHKKATHNQEKGKLEKF